LRVTILYASLFFLRTTRLSPSSTLFPYTTLFRSPRSTSSRRARSGRCCRRPCTRLTSERASSAQKPSVDRRSVREIRRHHGRRRDRKSTRLNSSHEWISYAVFCLKKKKKHSQTAEGQFGRRQRREDTRGIRQRDLR